MGVLDGIRILDLSWGAAGPMATMLLADHGAAVTKIEPPGGDPFRRQAGYTVWNRGKRSAAFDLKQRDGLESVLRLADQADVLVESFGPGTTARLGIDEPVVRGRNPRLIYCSITGYGRMGLSAGRPGFDALVAARTGLHWEQRGYNGTTMAHIRGIEMPESPWPVPPLVQQTAHRDGPAFLALPYPSIGAAILATMGIAAALFERELSGRGQWVETSLLQGILMEYVSCWQRVPDPVQPGYRLPYFDPRHPKGFFQCADGLWMHQWAPFEHEFIRAAAAIGGYPEHAEEREGRRNRPRAVPLPYEEAIRHEVEEYLITAEAVKELPRAQWIELFARAGKGAQPVFAPEEALMQPEWLVEGNVVEVDDPVHGPTFQVGEVYHLSASPIRPSRPGPAAGEHTEAVLSDLAKPPARTAPAPDASHANGAARNGGRGPLAGVRVLDFGLAVAGPFGPQMLSDLGADVIKVSNPSEQYTGNTPLQCHRGKRCLALDLKSERGLEIAYRLVESADVLHHNMRYAAAERLKIDYASLQRINPRLIYCHTRAFEAHGPRTHLPGNDQLGNALAGTAYELGGVGRGSPPIWHNTAWGDLGNGALSAVAVIKALYGRERTGKGQFVDTSILNGALLYNSSTFAKVDGTPTERPRIDAELLGLTALYRLYQTADEWLCLVVPDEVGFRALCTAIGRPDLVADPRFADTCTRQQHDAALAAVLEPVFRQKPAQVWQAALDRHGVPAEVSSHTFVQEMWDDPTLSEHGWVVSYPHPEVGTLEQAGRMVTFSETPNRIYGPPPLVGQHSREILAEIGYSDAEIDALAEEQVIRCVEV